MKKLTLDIETNLAHSTIWICVTQDVETGELLCHTEPSTLAPLVKEYDQVIGHNLIGFDAPVLEKLWNIGIPKSKQVDTLVLSRLLNPQQEGGHSLKSWGVRLRNDKIDFDTTDFDGGLTDEMITYCKQDVQLTTDLYNYLMSQFGKWKHSETSIAIEHEVAGICREQERNGFKFNYRDATLLRAEMHDRMVEIESVVQDVFPPIVEERWSEKTGKRLKDKVTVFNLGSRKQIADRLQSLGWKPTKLTEKGQPIVDETTLESLEFKEAQLIAEYLMLQKRVGLIDSWMKNADDNDRVHGYINTCGAVTGRMTHSNPNMGQIPSVAKPYGKECRSLWTVEDGNVLVGSDLSGIELRCLAHYMQDDDYTRELLDGDIHTKNQQAAGLPTRNNAKTFIYATLYGAGPAKIGSIVGGGSKEGQQLLKSFMENTPKLAKLMTKVKSLAEKGYVPGLDRRRVLVRSDHAALNSLLQSAGAIIAKQWCIEMHREFDRLDIPVKQVAFVHDEIQIECPVQYGEQVGRIMEESATKAGEVLGFRCRVDAESKIGKTWYDTH